MFSSFHNPSCLTLQVQRTQIMLLIWDRSKIKSDSRIVHHNDKWEIFAIISTEENF